MPRREFRVGNSSMVTLPRRPVGPAARVGFPGAFVKQHDACRVLAETSRGLAAAYGVPWQPMRGAEGTSRAKTSLPRGRNAMKLPSRQTLLHSPDVFL